MCALNAAIWSLPCLQKLQDEKDKQAAQEAKEAALQAAEARRKEEESKAKEDADAQQKQEDEQRQKQLKAREQADRAAKQYLQDAKARMGRLDEIQELSKQIFANPDPAIKQIRVDIKLQVRAVADLARKHLLVSTPTFNFLFLVRLGGCMQPNFCRAVCDQRRCDQDPKASSGTVHVWSCLFARGANETPKMLSFVMQTAKASGDSYFKYAMDLVATNLSKQARVVLDYK